MGMLLTFRCHHAQLEVSVKSYSIVSPPNHKNKMAYHDAYSRICSVRFCDPVCILFIIKTKFSVAQNLDFLHYGTSSDFAKYL